MSKIFDMIISQYNHYSYEDLNYQISSYIIHHMSTIKDHTLLQFSKNTYVSKTSVLKYINELGYSHFKTFVNAFHEEYLNILHYYDIVRKEMILKNINEYHDFQSFISLEQFVLITNIMKQSRKIVISGDYRAINCLSEFQSLLLFKGIDVKLIPLNNDKNFTYSLSELNEDDLLIVITPLESLESIIESHRFNEIDSFNEFMNKNIYKLFLGQKSYMSYNFDNSIYLELPFTINYYEYLHTILYLFEILSISLLK